MKHKLIFTASAMALLIGASFFLSAAKAPPLVTVPNNDVQFSFSKIYWEYNASANDLGVHVTLDGEDWTRLKIFRPNDSLLFDVRGRGPYQQLGMTELFFEGAEPSLDDYPLNTLLSQFPEGEYEFEGETVDDEDIEGSWHFSHAIPAGPRVFAQVGPNNFLRIRWLPVTTVPPGFPVLPIHIAEYQVIVGKFLVTLPATATSVTVPPEFVASLPLGVNPYEVLAIEQNANQTLTEGTFVH